MKTYKIAILLSYLSIASVSAVILTPALPQIGKFYSLAPSSLSWFVGIFLFGYVFGQLIYAPLANRFGRLKAIRFGFIINLIGLVICYIAATNMLSSYSLLLLGRVITALGSSAGLACTFTLVNELLNEAQAKKAISYSMLSFMLGIGIAVTLGGVVTQYLQWQDLFFILFIHGVLAYLSTFLFHETLQEKHSLHPIAIAQRYAHALKNHRLRHYALIIGLCSTVSYGYAAAAPMIAQHMLHLTPSEYGYWNLIALAGTLISGLSAPRILHRFDVNKIIIVAIAIIFIGAILLYLSVQFNARALVFFLICAVLYYFSGLLFPSATLFASSAIKDKASASSMMSFMNMGSARAHSRFVGKSAVV
ncbi:MULTISPECIES: MFS transporter [Cysteiniphilum]|uniref:MFS transporter n=1 Tax=Cysteiniphilum litorale TaxID=2056700 RepID=A0A8J3E9W2_9GAMM|nr:MULTISPECIES: MFS transporter [Cysteiniphilum]GGG04084.1 MFS transporter [Cysteiniphilum litorale]